DEGEELGTGELVIEEGMVGQIAGDRLRRLGCLAHVVPAEDDRPRRRLEEAHHHADRGGLAGAVAAEEAEDGAWRDLEIEEVDGHQWPPALAQTDETDHDGRSTVANSRRPSSPASPRCCSGPPSTSFTWVASAGI